MNERTYLRDVQYRDDTNLDARVELHRRFSVNSRSFHRWVFDQLDVPGRARLLEMGCGPEHLWAANRERMPAGWEAFLSDFSYGMITAARSRLGAGFRLEVADARRCRTRRARSTRRLRTTCSTTCRTGPARSGMWPGCSGRTARCTRLPTAATTCVSWTSSWPAGSRRVRRGSAEPRSDLRTAPQLAAGLADVEVRLWRDALEVTDAEAIVAYVRSLPVGSEADADGLRHEATVAIEREGAFRVRKATGLFIARSPIQSSP